MLFQLHSNWQLNYDLIMSNAFQLPETFDSRFVVLAETFIMQIQLGH